MFKTTIMNRTTRFMVEIITTDKIVSDDDKNEMAQNIANAIQKEANEYGVTPENSDGCVDTIYVKEWYSDKQIIEHTDTHFLMLKKQREN